MAEDYNNKQLSKLNIFPKPEVKTELCNDSKVENENFVEEIIWVKREEDNFFISDSDDEGEGGNEDGGIFPDVREVSDLNSSVDPLKYDASRIYDGGTIPSSEVIKTEQPIVLDNFFDESEYQEEETDSNYNYNDDPVDTMIDLGDSHPAPVPIQQTRKSTKKFPCPKCDRAFSQKSSLKRHIASHSHQDVDEDVRCFSCPQCKQQFHFKNNLNLHLKLNHKEPSKDTNYEKQVGSHFHCTICNVNFKYKKSFSKHIQSSHLNKKASTSRKNNKVAKSQKNLKPSTSSKKKTWFPCENCDEVFPLAKLLGKHQSTVHSIPNGIFPKYKCEPCNKLFWKSSSFMNHNRTNHKLTKRKERIAGLKKEKMLRLKKERSKNSNCLEEGNTLKISGEKKNLGRGRGRPRKISVESSAVNC